MFDTAEELLAKIRLGEDALIEFKSVRFRGDHVSGPRRDELADEIAAMANTAGGVVILGVDDQTREVEGIPVARLDAVEALVREVLNDSIDPPLPALVLRIELPDVTGQSQAVLRIEVPRGLFVHKSPGGYFNRIGSSKRELTTEQLLRLGQQRSQARIIRFDEQPVPGTTIEHIDLERVRPFLAPSDPVELALSKLLVLREESGALLCSVGGLLVFGKKPQEHLPNARIEAVQYRGLRADANYQLDARTCDGPMPDQIDSALTFVLKNMRVAAQKAPAREDLPQFDARAVFEAIVNAAIHRDYSIHGSKIRLFMFDDRLEIYSPGALPNSVTVETLSTRQATRNELIVRFLSKTPVRGFTEGLRTRYVEARGEGVPLIIDRSRGVSGIEPAYEVLGEELRLTIFGRPSPAQDEPGS
jgi:predicted HTH transcriptional regulator